MTATARSIRRRRHPWTFSSPRTSERLLALMEGAGENVADYMNALAAHGKYTVKPETAQKNRVRICLRLLRRRGHRKDHRAAFCRAGLSSRHPHGGCMERRRAVPHKKRKRSPARRRLHCQPPSKFCKSVLEALGETSFAAGTGYHRAAGAENRKARTAPLAGLAGKPCALPM